MGVSRARPDSAFIASLRRRRITVKFALGPGETLPFTTGSALDAALLAFAPGHFEDFTLAYPGARFSPRVRSMDPVAVRDFIDAAVAADPDFHDPGFLAYYSVNVPRNADVAQMLRDLRSWGDKIEVLYVDPGPPHPTAHVTPDDEGAEAGKQRYVESAPLGIDAEFAWGIDGGDGEGQVIAIVEADWFHGHVDLPGNRATVIGTSVVPGEDLLLPGDGEYVKAHGTGTLGIVAGRDNGQGVIGLAPEVAAIGLSSFWRPCAPSDSPDDPCEAWGDAPTEAMTYLAADPETAIWEAIEWLTSAKPNGGGVLLLEAEDYLDDFDPDLPHIAIPIEARELAWQMIKTAVQVLEIVVVAAAANGGQPLAAIPYPAGQDLVDPSASDSGSIMVASAIPAGPDGAGVYQPAETPLLIRGGETNYGARIDCFAWGKNVWATTYQVGDHDAYGEHDGTSSASAIIAGAVLILQGIAEKCLGQPLLPDTVRGLLKTPGYGTLPIYPIDDLTGLPKGPADPAIGAMPDLRAILQGESGGAGVLGACKLVPDVYVRDNSDDIGDPHGPPVASSPDIICRQAAAADPQQAWGEGSGTESDMKLGQTVLANHQHFLYVRTRNRGMADGYSVTAKAYWSEVATLVTPDMWKFIGGVTIPRVRHGGALTVSPGIVWPAGNVPAAGFYCFVALIGHPDDPEPSLGPFATFPDYVAFVKNENNVAWCNFNVVPIMPSLGPLKVLLKFLFPGAFDIPRFFELGVETNAPQHVGIDLDLPEWLGKSLWPAEGKRVRPDFWRIPLLPKARRVPLGPFELAAGSRHEMRLHLTIPAQVTGRGFQVAVKQIFEGEEIGRVTWRLTAAIGK